MSKKKKDDLVIPKGTEITYAYVSFKFAITKDEAYQVLNNKKGAIARKMRKYMYDILKEACSRFFEEEKPKEESSDCKEM